MHIDLSDKSDFSMPSAPSGSGGLHLYLRDLCVLDLPDEGCITFKYKKGPVTATEAGEDTAASASCDLTLTAICAVEAEEGEKVEDDMDETSESIDELFEQAARSESDRYEEVETKDAD
jgi:hypothetical protein